LVPNTELADANTEDHIEGLRIGSWETSQLGEMGDSAFEPGPEFPGPVVEAASSEVEEKRPSQLAYTGLSTVKDLCHG